jgi:predicted nucleic acid-binding protein
VTDLYFDASAFVKTVVDEPESDALRSYLSRVEGMHTSSALLRTEALRAVRHLGREATGRMRQALDDINLVAVTDGILEAAAMMDPGVMRTLDAIHLATALALGPDLVSIISYDRRMRDGAALLGLSVQSPA